VEVDVSFEDQFESVQDLDVVKRALIREQAIRGTMANTGESREVVAETLDALDAMAQEAVLDLVGGEPTTLRAALQKYADDLATSEPGEDVRIVLGDLDALLAFRWPDHG
jgi:hypothetical protein